MRDLFCRFSSFLFKVFSEWAVAWRAVGGSLACGRLGRGHEEVAADPSDEAWPFVSWRIHHHVSRARASRSVALARLDVASKLLGDEAAQTSRAAESGRRDAASAVVPARAQGRRDGQRLTERVQVHIVGVSLAPAGRPLAGAGCDEP